MGDSFQNWVVPTAKSSHAGQLGTLDDKDMFTEREDKYKCHLFTFLSVNTLCFNYTNCQMPTILKSSDNNATVQSKQVSNQSMTRLARSFSNCNVAGFLEESEAFRSK